MSTHFEDINLLHTLHAMDDAALDRLDFGVIAFDKDTVVRRYNLNESQATGVKAERVIGSRLFTEVAQCMNNFLVAQRFLDALDTATVLDDTIDFVLTWRMRPTPVKLRLLSFPATPLQYLLLQRAS